MQILYSLEQLLWYGQERSGFFGSTIGMAFTIEVFNGDIRVG